MLFVKFKTLKIIPFLLLLFYCQSHAGWSDWFKKKKNNTEEVVKKVKTYDQEIDGVGYYSMSTRDSKSFSNLIGSLSLSRQESYNSYEAIIEIPNNTNYSISFIRIIIVVKKKQYKYLMPCYYSDGFRRYNNIVSYSDGFAATIINRTTYKQKIDSWWVEEIYYR